MDATRVVWPSDGPRGCRPGRRDASRVGARDQAGGRPSGGSSRREALRDGRTHGEGAGRTPRGPSGPGGPPIASAAALPLPTWPPEGLAGSPESPHGADFMQGLGSSPARSGGWASGGRGGEGPRRAAAAGRPSAVSAAFAEMGMRFGLDPTVGRDRGRRRPDAPAGEAEQHHDRREEPAGTPKGPDVLRLELHGSGLVDGVEPYPGGASQPQWS